MTRESEPPVQAQSANFEYFRLPGRPLIVPTWKPSNQYKPAMLGQLGS